MRIMVTGLTGQIGGALIKAFGTATAVLGVGRDQLDMNDCAQIASVLDRIDPELIINPAAYTAVDRAEDEPDLAFRINAQAPGIIARWAAARGVPLVHFSTDYVFDGAGDRPWREDDEVNPLSVYGASKLAGETAIRAAGGPHLIIRTSWVYAASGSNFLRTISELAKQRRELRVVADQFGAPTSARLIAETVVSIVRRGTESIVECFATTGGLLHLTASGETSWHGFALAIADGLRKRGVQLAVENVVPIASHQYPAKAKRPANSRFDLTRLRDLTLVEPPHWRDDLDRELDQLAPQLASDTVGQRT